MLATSHFTTPIREACVPLSSDIVHRLKHHDFSQSLLQMVYSKLYDSMILW